MEEPNEIFKRMKLDSFKGLTTTSLDILNARLGVVDLPKISTLLELKRQSESGLFRKTLQDVGKKGKYNVILKSTQEEFLKASGVPGISGLNLDAITKVSEKAVEMTNELQKPLPVQEKTIAGRRTREDAKYFTTACGESFDPERCFLDSKSPYSLYEVESFMDRYNIYRPKNADYNNLCDILRQHWTKYMTDVLIDLFTKQKATDLTSTQLHTLANERGIQTRGVSDEELGRQLIRYMVSSLLTIDATQYGLGDAAVSIVDTIMDGTLDITSDVVTPKQRLAIIMIGARWNPRLLGFVSVPDYKNDRLRLEFENFQQAIHNLRTAVKGLSPQQSVKAASQLASTIAKTTQANQKQTAAAVSEQTEIPLPTPDRAEDDIIHFIAGMKFASQPESTFHILSEVFRNTDFFKQTSVGNFIVFAFDDQFILQSVLPALKCSREKFESLKALGDALALNTFRDFGPFKAGNIKSLKGKEWPIRKVKSGWVADDKADPKQVLEISISPDVLTHRNLKFHRLQGLLLTVAVRDELIAQSKTLEVPVKKSAPRVERKTVPEKPKVVQVEKPLSDEEMMDAWLKGKNYSTVSDFLYGPRGVLKQWKDADPNRFNVDDLVRLAKMSRPEAEILKRIAIAFNAQKRINRNFDVQIGASGSKALLDLLKMKIHATPAKPPPPKPKTLLEVIRETPEISDFYSNFLTSLDLTKKTYFVPSNAALKSFMDKYEVNIDHLKDPDNISAVQDAHSTSEIVNEEDTFAMDDGSERDLDEMGVVTPLEGADGKIYIIQEVLESDELKGQLGLEISEARSERPAEPEKQTLEDVPDRYCERFEYLAQKAGLKARKMRDVFESGPLRWPSLDLATSTTDEFRDAYLAQLTGELPQYDFDDIASVFSGGFTSFLYTIAVAYKSNTRSADLAFGCDELGKLHIAGQRKLVTGASVPLPTPLPVKQEEIPVEEPEVAAVEEPQETLQEETEPPLEESEIPQEEIPVVADILTEEPEGRFVGTAPVDVEIPESLKRAISPPEEESETSEEDEMHNFVRDASDLTSAYKAFTESTQFDGLDVFNWARDRTITLFVPNDTAWANANLSMYESDDLDTILKHHIMDDAVGPDDLKRMIKAKDHELIMLDDEEEHIDLKNDHIYFRETAADRIISSHQLGNSWLHVISTVLVPLGTQIAVESPVEEQTEEVGETNLDFDLEGLADDI